MNVNNVKNKLITNADKVGLLVGAGKAISEHGKAWWDDGKGHFKDMIKESVRLAMKDPHFPDLGHVLDDCTTGYSSKVTIPAAQLYVAGEVADWFGVIDKRWTNAVKKGSVGAIKGAALWSLFLHSGGYHSPRSKYAGVGSSGSRGSSGDVYSQRLY